ncbi:MAG TPA: hypothetical protein VF590_08835 [Isosphaeraceae bacterium]
MRRIFVLALAALTVGGLATFAGNGSDPARRARVARAPGFTPEREAAALTFVGQHHPELATLLDRLKPMNRPAYEQAVGELFQVSETLANLRQRDGRRYELGLAAWRAKSRAERLAAELAGGARADVESRLRAALADQIDVQVRQHRLDLEQAEARARKTREALDRLEAGRADLLESRYQGLIKKARRARRPDRGPSAPARPARPDGEPKA